MRKFLVVVALLASLSIFAILNPNYVSPVVEVVKQCAPAVVKIDVVRIESVPYFDPFADEFFKRFFGDVPWGYGKREVRGVGSGFIFDKEGYILTNEHVVKDAKQITVTMLDGTTYKAEYIGGDDELDIAVIKINPKGKNLPVLEFGDSDKVQIGEWAIAIGNPLGFQHTVTLGVVSALHRKILKPDGKGYYTDLIQTDAAINPGNSGGPLLNIHGQVIGINTAIVDPREAVNLGFAIPINTAKRFIDSLIRTGKAEKAYLGVRITDVTQDLKKALALKVDRGALVTEVVKGSPADIAGIKEGDVIVKINNQDITSAGVLVSVIHSYTPGSTVKVVVDRRGKRLELTVTLGKYEESEGGAKSFLGIKVGEITAGDRETFSIPTYIKGVIVREVEKSLFGIKVGDVILKIVINGKEYKLESIDDWNKAIGDLHKGDYVALYIYRKGAKLYVAFPYTGE